MGPNSDVAVVNLREQPCALLWPRPSPPPSTGASGHHQQGHVLPARQRARKWDPSAVRPLEKTWGTTRSPPGVSRRVRRRFEIKPSQEGPPQPVHVAGRGGGRAARRCGVSTADRPRLMKPVMPFRTPMTASDMGRPPRRCEGRSRHGRSKPPPVSMRGLFRTAVTLSQNGTSQNGTSQNGTSQNGTQNGRRAGAVFGVRASALLPGH